MRGRIVVLPLIACLFLMVPATQAVVWIEDASGDAQTRLLGTDLPIEHAAYADALSVELDETPDAFLFTFRHGPAEAAGAAFLEGATHFLNFRHGGAAFQVRMYVYFPVGGTGVSHAATFYEVTDGAHYHGQLPVEEAGDGAIVTVDKALLRDLHGVKPEGGRSLEDPYVEVHGDTIMYTDLTVGPALRVPEFYDRMPDDGFGLPYETVFGLQQEGDLYLGSPEPLRWSNGEATTFVYEVVVGNDGDDADEVALVASELPPGWRLGLPAPISVPAGGEMTAAVAVEVPFAHAHGSEETFLLEAVGASGTGRLHLGVYYPEIPQPTGHHSTLFIHSRAVETNPFEQALFGATGSPRTEVAWMNALDADPADERVPVPGHKSDLARFDDGTLGTAYSWVLPLNPGLRMGINLDGNAEGIARLTFDDALPSQGIRVEGRLVVAPADTDRRESSLVDPMGEVLASFDSGMLDAATTTFELPIIVEETGVPFESGQQLFLELYVSPNRPEPPLSPSVGLSLLAGQLDLPLLEFHDTVPVEIAVPPAVVEEAEEALLAPAQDDAVEESPLPAFGWLTAAMLWVARRRRLSSHA